MKRYKIDTYFCLRCKRRHYSRKRLGMQHASDKSWVGEHKNKKVQHISGDDRANYSIEQDLGF